MSSSSVLYDVPGPRARRSALISGIVAALVVLGLILLVVIRLADRGQFAGRLWGPVLNPSDENFQLVWNLLGKGVLATLTAATLAIGFSLVIGAVIGVARMISAMMTQL